MALSSATQHEIDPTTVSWTVSHCPTTVQQSQNIFILFIRNVGLFKSCHNHTEARVTVITFINPHAVIIENIVKITIQVNVFT